MARFQATRVVIARPLSLMILLAPLLVAGCDETPTATEGGSQTTIDIDPEEDELQRMEGITRETPPASEKQSGQPVVMSVVDESANPVIERHLLTPEEAAAGWISLFDGATLFGWKSNNPDVKWRVQDGTITADVGPVGMLHTTVPFADFELICEFKYSANGNSGLFLRTTENPVDLQKDCIEVNIADEQPDGYLTGSLVNRMKTQNPVKPSTDWQTLHVTVIGNRCLVELNSEFLLEYQDAAAESRKFGFIGLQQRFGTVEFRKVNLKPMALKTLFNGTNLMGWNVVPGSVANFHVEQDSIHAQGGPGFLETEGKFKDFIFQTSVRTDVRGVNSGFFFRAEPGTEKTPSNGYEVQIHNGFKGTDRDKPDNSGSGAIFRRVEARRVVANDLEWSTISLVTYGPQISTWVDGYQQVDWIDTRAPDANPRKGLRLDAGQLSLQAHDPTTDVEFRFIRAAEFREQPSPSEK